MKITGQCQFTQPNKRIFCLLTEKIKENGNIKGDLPLAFLDYSKLLIFLDFKNPCEDFHVGLH